MFGTGIGHFIPLAAYLGFWIMCLVSLGGRPLFGLYYMLPFLPYRLLRDHFIDYPLGANMMTILVLAVIVGALIHGKRLPKSKLYLIWLVFAVYLYLSMWIGAWRFQMLLHHFGSLTLTSLHGKTTLSFHWSL
jgi:hypothetical protein